MSDRLESQGVTGPARDLLLAVTASARHQARVEAALAVVEHLPRPLAALAIVLDAVGVGGTKGLEGRATARLPIFRQLGKGRKQASDGDAWSAALLSALFKIVGTGTLVLGPTAVSLGERDSDEFGWNDQDFIPKPWGHALSGNVLVHLVTGSPLPEVLTNVRLEGDVSGWATVFNRFNEEAPTP